MHLLALLPAVAVLRADTSTSNDYIDRYREINALAPLPDQIAAVSDLVLRRGGAEIVVSRGTLYLLSPVGGRTVGAVFRGAGRITLNPPHPAEQQALRRLIGSDALNDSLDEVILIFSDSTANQLRRRGRAGGPDRRRARFRRQPAGKKRQHFQRRCPGRATERCARRLLYGAPTARPRLPSRLSDRSRHRGVRAAPQAGEHDALRGELVRRHAVRAHYLAAEQRADVALPAPRRDASLPNRGLAQIDTGNGSRFRGSRPSHIVGSRAGGAMALLRAVSEADDRLGSLE